MLSDDIYDIVMNFVFFMSLAQKNMFLSKKTNFQLKEAQIGRKETKSKIFLEIESLKNLNALASPKHHNLVKFDQFTCSNSSRVALRLAQKVIFLMCLKKFQKKFFFRFFLFVGFSPIIWQQDRQYTLKCCQKMSIVDI